MSASKELSILEFHDRFWIVEPAKTSDVGALEAELGFEMPSMLREVFGNTSFRESLREPHLEPGESLGEESDYLVIGENEEDTVWRAIRVADLQVPDPKIWEGIDGTWSPRDYTLTEFLKSAWTVNRPFTEPYAIVSVGSSDEIRSLDPDVSALDLPSQLGLDNLVSVARGFVFDDDTQQIGAKTDSQLKRLLDELDAWDEAEVFWASEGRQ